MEREREKEKRNTKIKTPIDATTSKCASRMSETNERTFTKWEQEGTRSPYSWMKQVTKINAANDDKMRDGAQ